MPSDAKISFAWREFYRYHGILVAPSFNLDQEQNISSRNISKLIPTNLPANIELLRGLPILVDELRSRNPGSKTSEKPKLREHCAWTMVKTCQDHIVPKSHMKVRTRDFTIIRTCIHIRRPLAFFEGEAKRVRRRLLGLLVVDVLLIPCALSWRRSGVWLCRIHCQEAAALGLFGAGCVTFSVYVGGLVSFLLGVPKLHLGTLRRTDSGTLRRTVFCFVWGRI